MFEEAKVNWWEKFSDKEMSREESVPGSEIEIGCANGSQHRIVR
jgi:hypothetical protein